MSAVFGLDITNESLVPANLSEGFIKSVLGEDLFKEEKANGCTHKFNRKKYNYCGECGAKSFIINPALTWYDLLDEYQGDIAKGSGMDFEWVGGEWVIGVDITDKMDLETFIVKAKEASNKLKKYFPNSVPVFYSYSS